MQALRECAETAAAVGLRRGRRWLYSYKRTCFVSTKVQILTLQMQALRESAMEEVSAVVAREMTRAQWVKSSKRGREKQDICPQLMQEHTYARTHARTHAHTHTHTHTRTHRKLCI
jgi:hypothetical protein